MATVNYVGVRNGNRGRSELEETCSLRRLISGMVDGNGARMLTRKEESLVRSEGILGIPMDMFRDFAETGDFPKSLVTPVGGVMPGLKSGHNFSKLLDLMQVQTGLPENSTHTLQITNNDVVGGFTPWGEAATLATPTITETASKPVNVCVPVAVSRRLLTLSGNTGESVLRSEIFGAVARTLEYGMLAGSGSDGEPVGLLTDSNIPSVALGTNGAALTWAKIREAVRTLRANDAVSNEDSLRWIVNPKTEESCRGVERISDSGQFLLNEDGRMCGIPAMISNLLPSNLEKAEGENLSGLIVGDFSRVVWSFHGDSVVELRLDPYTKSKERQIVIRCFAQVSFVYNPKGFIRIVDIVA